MRSLGPSRGSLWGCPVPTPCQGHPSVTAPTQVRCLQMVFPGGLGDSLRILLLNQAFCSTGRDPAAGTEPCSCTELAHAPGTILGLLLMPSPWHHCRLASSQQEKLKNRTNHRKHSLFWGRKDLVYSTCHWNKEEGGRFGT